MPAQVTEKLIASTRIRNEFISHLPDFISAAISKIASHTGHAEAVKSLEDRAAAMEKAVKEQVVYVVVAAIGKFMTDKVFLKFVQDTLMLVFTNPKAPPAQRLNILLEGFIEFKAPAPADQRDNQHQFLNCAGGKLMDVFKTNGDLAAATETIKITTKLQAKYNITPATTAETIQKARELQKNVAGASTTTPVSKKK